MSYKSLRHINDLLLVLQSLGVMSISNKQQQHQRIVGSIWRRRTIAEVELKVKEYEAMRERQLDES
jgi:hypothetical protein